MRKAGRRATDRMRKQVVATRDFLLTSRDPFVGMALGYYLRGMTDPKTEGQP